MEQTDSLPLTKLLTLEKVAFQIRREGWVEKPYTYSVSKAAEFFSQ